MKKVFLTTAVSSISMLFVLLIPMKLLRAQSYCSTPQSDMLAAENELLCGMSEQGPFYIRVYFHVMKNTSGNVAMTEQQVKDVYKTLQQDFAPHNIFFVWDCDIDYIVNNDYYNLLYSDVLGENSHTNGIDIYLGREVGQASCSDSYAYSAGTPSKSFYVWGNFWKPPYNILTQSHFVSHEMGHCLGLDHTFSNNQACNPDESNCCTCGDYVCDTPADPGTGWCVDPVTCDWLGTLANPCPTCNLFSNGIPIPTFPNTSIPYLPNTKNFMAYGYPSCMDHFSEGQGQRMRNMIATKQVLKNTLLSNASSGITTEIVTNTIFSTPMDMPGDILVRNGAELTITTTIGMPWQKRIIVERNARLIVDGGILRPTCGSPDWAGINVWGNTAKEQPLSPYVSLSDADQCGFVVVKNNSRIEQARCAISTSSPGIGWPAVADNYGGLVVCDSSYFINCRRGAEFMQYPNPSANHGFVNKSRFTNCHFEEEVSLLSGSSEGVTIWDTDGIRFEKCRFVNMDNEGILTYDAGVTIINDNHFISNRRGVLNTATYPFGYHVQIGDYVSTPNHFEGNQIHIDAFAANKQGGVRIYNNEFFGGNTAVWLEGPTDFRVNDNKLYGQSLGMVTYSTGTQNLFLQNVLNCNDFNDEYGIVFAGENRRTQFLTNKFNNTNIDVVISEGNEAGAIRSTQGTISGPAGNCFTNPVQDADVLTDGSTLSFRYYYRLETSCDENPDTPGNYTESPTNGQPDDCGQDAEGFEIPPTKDDLTAKRLQVQSLTTQHQLSPGNEYIESALLSALEEKEAILKYLIGDALESNNYTAAELILTEEGSTAANQTLFGLKFSRGAFAEAQALLDVMPLVTQDDIWFKQVQEINLFRIQSGTDYSLDELQKNLLSSIANSESPVRGYAQAILTLMTGQRFERQMRVLSRSKKEVEPSLTATGQYEPMRITPNPSQGRFTVFFNHPMILGSQIRVTDFYGRTIHQQEIAHRSVVEVESARFSEGIYIVTVYQPGGRSFQQKVMITH